MSTTSSSQPPSNGPQYVSPLCWGWLLILVIYQWCKNLCSLYSSYGDFTNSRRCLSTRNGPSLSSSYWGPSSTSSISTITSTSCLHPSSHPTCSWWSYHPIEMSSSFFLQLVSQTLLHSVWRNGCYPINSVGVRTLLCTNTHCRGITEDTEVTIIDIVINE